MTVFSPPSRGAAIVHRGIFAALLPAMLLAGCAREPRPILPSGQQAYEAVPQGDVLEARDYLAIIYLT